MIGLKIIKEMSREELIEEIIAVNRAKLEQEDMVTLKSCVANNRIASYRDSLMREAGLRETGTFLGNSVVTDDENTD